MMECLTPGGTPGFSSFGPHIGFQGDECAALRDYGQFFFPHLQEVNICPVDSTGNGSPLGRR